MWDIGPKKYGMWDIGKVSGIWDIGPKM